MNKRKILILSLLTAILLIGLLFCSQVWAEEVTQDQTGLAEATPEMSISSSESAQTSSAELSPVGTVDTTGEVTDETTSPADPTIGQPSEELENSTSGTGIVDENSTPADSDSDTGTAHLPSPEGETDDGQTTGEEAVAPEEDANSVSVEGFSEGETANEPAINLVDPRVLVIHSSTSTKMTNDAAHNIMRLIDGENYKEKGLSERLVNFDIRTTTQIGQMSPDELKSLIENADIVICEWMFEPGLSNFKNVINANPDIVKNKPNKIFLVLQSYLELTKLSQINGKLLFDGVPDSIIGDTSKKGTILYDLKNANTERLNDYKAKYYPQISDWIDAGLYFAQGGTVNYENQFKWLLKKYTELNGDKWPPDWNPAPPYTLPKEMLYRDGKIFTSLGEYLAQYPLDPSKPTVGIVEYTSPMLAGNMDHFQSMIDKLTEKDLNVIPVVGAYSGTIGDQPVNIYSAMVKFFTGAPSTAEYEANPQNYPSKIDALVSFFYFSLGSGFVDQTNQFLANINVPVFRAMTSTKRTEGEWLASDDGLLWSDTYYQIAIPETQGIIEPIFVATTEKEMDPITGAEWVSYKAIPKRIERLVNRVYNLLQLRIMDNADKRIALIYYNYPPGKQNIGASYLAVPASILEILQRLKQEGYNVGEIPQSVDEFVSIMLERGINVANWAPGILEELANNPNTILWDVDEYIAWFENLDSIAKKQLVEGPVGYIEEITKVGVKYGATDETAKAATINTIEKWTQEMISLANTYPEKSQQAIEQINKMSSALKQIMDGEDAWDAFYEAKNTFLALAIPGLIGWGEPPGNVMVVKKDGKEYFVIPGMFFGNLFIGPEPQRGWEADASKFYHSTVVPPPHQYLAWYAWVNEVFDAHAQVHVGRHATYEWLPRKQVALASFDYPDIMIADTPSVYIYIVDGVGEGLQAKRRGYAVIIDHLTPPLKTTTLYGEFVELKGLVDDYEKTPADNPMKEEYKTKIKEKIKELNLCTDLGIEDPNNITDEDIEKLHEYLMNLQQTLMPYGLHTFGKSWTDAEIALLAAAMVSADGGIDSPSLQRLLAQENGWDFDNLTLDQAEKLNNRAQEWMLLLITGQKAAADLTSKPQLQMKLNEAKGYADKIRASFGSELDALIEGLSGGYITPSSANDPIRNPEAIPTGKNFYGISENLLPTKVAWSLGKKLADMALSQLESIPEKIAAVVWCVETARDDGTMVSFVLRILGIEPTWTRAGSTDKMKATSLSTLLSDLNAMRASKGLSPLTERPRIDVVVTTSGLFRDLFGRLLINMDRSFRVALAASYDKIVEQYPDLQPSLDYALQPLIDAKYTGFKGNDPIEQNYIAKHWIELTQKYVDLGIPANDAGELAITRIFAPPVGDYGAGVNKAVEQSWTWENRDQVADVYLNRMSHSYSERGWGNTNIDLFKDLLQGITIAYHSRSTNLYGVLDNDDYYDYYGGLSMAIEKVNNGQAPSLNVLYYANPANPQVTSLLQFMTREMRTRYYNPEWIQGMMDEGYSGARTISNKFVAYLWGWQVTNPNMVQDWMWNEVTDVYVRDKYNLGVSEWLSQGKNAYAMISITGTLLTAAQKGFWQADEVTLKEIANTWANLIAQHGPSCCDCSCGNIAMMKWATSFVNSNLLLALHQALLTATGQSILTPEQLEALLPKPEQPPVVSPGHPPETSAPTTPVTRETPAGIAAMPGIQEALREVVEAAAMAPVVSPGTRPSETPRAYAAQVSPPISAGETPAEAGKAPSPGPSAGEKRAYEVKKAGVGTPAPGRGWIPLAAILGVLLFVSLGVIGYFKESILAFLIRIMRR
ncbi:MAG: cobaltochelatase subunit CobN [Actinomycetota bacterium]|nr:cobaltochelatase subunit CobN [Actinomycetota bacterium]